jgi:hypothetical protein
VCGTAAVRVSVRLAPVRASLLSLLGHMGAKKGSKSSKSSGGRKAQHAKDEARESAPVALLVALCSPADKLRVACVLAVPSGESGVTHPSCLQEPNGTATLDRDTRMEFARPHWEALSKAERHALLLVSLADLDGKAASADVGTHLPALARTRSDFPASCFRRTPGSLGNKSGAPHACRRPRPGHGAAKGLECHTPRSRGR